jgi:DNA-binding MarR family transcriptional regulator
VCNDVISRLSYNDINDLRDSEYVRLLKFRDALRRFQVWSEAQAVEAGLTPARHQLLLAIRGHPGGHPTIGEVAAHLLLRHHSVVELIDRAVGAGLVVRHRDKDDARVVRLGLTRQGATLLARLSTAHAAELKRLARAGLDSDS